jgi:ABC-type molybdate transport system ATPase subunit
VGLHLSCISKDYQDKEEDFEKLKNRVGGYFESFDRIDYSAWDRSIQIDGKNATATQQLRIEVENKDVRINIPGEKCSTYVKKEGSGRSSAGYERIGLRFDNRKKT